MTTKDGVDKKRKASSSYKGKPDSKVKKAKLEVRTKAPKPTKKEEDKEESFESFSDSEDGGAKLDDGSAPKRAKAKETFERGLFSVCPGPAPLHHR